MNLMVLRAARYPHRYSVRARRNAMNATPGKNFLLVALCV